MLYPLTTFTTLRSDDTYVIPNGNLFAFPFTIGEGEAKNIVVVHTAGTSNQDHSLRAWVSTEAGGTVLYDAPAFVQMWHPNRNAAEYVTAYDRGIEAPQAPMPLALAPGDYVLNVLNLSNRQNVFAFVLTELV